jgi:hypothetical protein
VPFTRGYAGLGAQSQGTCCQRHGLGWDQDAAAPGRRAVPHSQAPAELIDQLEETFAEDESVEVDSVILIVSVKYGLFDGTHVPLWHNSPGLPIHEALVHDQATFWGTDRCS